MERVQTFAAVLLDRYELSRDKTLQVPGGCRPGVTEAVRELTRCHRPTARVEGDEDVPPMLVGQCAEDCLELVELTEAT
ncbi:MAG TPA: hypothetical protein VMK16_15455 [Acidimicrobiales bacterium]|nr:hypothetical protein [Acidimicrobiales bacterium]